MSIPQHHIDKAKAIISDIDREFQDGVAANPANALGLLEKRKNRVEHEIYPVFRNDRRREIETERDDNTLHLKCRAGRGRPFGSVPRDSKSGTIRADNSDWMNVPEENDVHVHNSISGSHSVKPSDDKSEVKFSVSCKGVAVEDARRGHGAHDATLHAIFRLKEDAILDMVALEILELQNIIGI